MQPRTLHAVSQNWFWRICSSCPGRIVSSAGAPAEWDRPGRKTPSMPDTAVSPSNPRALSILSDGALGRMGVLARAAGGLASQIGCDLSNHAVTGGSSSAFSRFTCGLSIRSPRMTTASVQRYRAGLCDWVNYTTVLTCCQSSYWLPDAVIPRGVVRIRDYTDSPFPRRAHRIQQNGIARLRYTPEACSQLAQNTNHDYNNHDS